jgi:hypothetical protein
MKRIYGNNRTSKKVTSLKKLTKINKLLYENLLFRFNYIEFLNKLYNCYYFFDLIRKRVIMLTNKKIGLFDLRRFEQIYTKQTVDE